MSFHDQYGMLYVLCSCENTGYDERLQRNVVQWEHEVH